MITDLDFLLGNEFSVLEASSELGKQRNELLSMLDTFMDGNGGVPEPNTEKIKQAQQRGDIRALWLKVRTLQSEYKAGEVSWDVVAQAVDEFFAWERYWGRRDLLKSCANDEVFTHKRALIGGLRRHGIFVLEKGAIEDYYPPTICGEGKPAKAQCLCNTVRTRQDALALCAGGHNGTNGNSTSEFEAIFQMIFTS